MKTQFFGAFLTLATYALFHRLSKRYGYALLNPILLSTICCIAILLLCGVDYEAYSASASPISWLLTPATICLAVPLYKQLETLRRNFLAILSGVACGTICSMALVWGLSALCGLNRVLYESLLPKSITTAIGMPLSTELGGDASVTVIAIMLSGLCGNMVGSKVSRLAQITEPTAVGLAFGTASHAIGTTRALRITQLHGAVSSLSIVVTGILTVIVAPLFAKLPV